MVAYIKPLKRPIYTHTLSAPEAPVPARDELTCAMRVVQVRTLKCRNLQT